MNSHLLLRSCRRTFALVLGLVFSASLWAAAPQFTQQPTARTAYVGGSVAFDDAVVSGSAPITFQWRRNGVNVIGATGQTLTLSALTMGSAGNYTLVATNSQGSATSTAATLTMLAAVAPTVSSIYSSSTVYEGQSAYFYPYYVTGSDPFTFQWYKDGIAITGANGWEYSIVAATQASAGSYTLKVTNAGGSVTSSPVALSVRLPDPPLIEPNWGNPTNTSVFEGQGFYLMAYASGTAPFTIVWKKDGTTVETQTFQGNSGYFAINPATLSDAGSYTATFTNSAGTATTAGAQVTINPAVAPTVTQQPQSASVYISNYVSFSMSATGTDPMTIQWYHDGALITGATGSWYYISSAKAADAGTYKAIATNIKGTASTNEATLTVNTPPAPVVQSDSPDTSVVQGNSFGTSVSFQSAVSATCQWYHDGVAIPDATSSYIGINHFKESDAGLYRLAVTNSGGTTYSRAFRLSYVPAELPVFTSQPVDTSCLPGDYITLGVSVTCNANVTYQWYKDGVAMPNTTWQSFQVTTDVASSTHSYYVVATSPAGSVASNSATVYVGPAQPARLLYEPSASRGSYISLSANATGTQPLFYQWYRNGTAIPDATSSWYYDSAATAGDYADYNVVVSNAAGSDASERVTARPALGDSSYPSEFWIGAQRRGDVYYFLMTNPGRIERYDLATESWLPTWSVDGIPGAFALADDAIYVAIERSVSKYPANWGTAVPLANEASNVRSMVVAGSYLVVTSSNYSDNISTLNRQTGTRISTKSLYGGFPRGRLSYDAGTGRVFASTSGMLVASDGTLGDLQSVSGTSYDYAGGGTLLPGGRGVDSAGWVFNTADMTAAGNFDGWVDDVVSSDDGFLVLRGSRVLATDLHFGLLSSLTVPGRGERLVRKQDAVLVFGQPTTAAARPPVWKAVLSELSAPTVAPIASPTDLVFTPQEITTDNYGVIYILNRLERNIFRWSPASRSYLPSIPLPFKAEHFTVEPDGSAVYVDNGSRSVRKINLGSGSAAGAPFFVSSTFTGAMVKAGNLLVVGPEESGSTVALSSAGAVVGTCSGSWLPTVELSWVQSARRLVRRSQSYYPVECMSLADDGTFGAPISCSGSYVAMVRMAPDGTSIITEQGYAYALPSMSWLGSLPSTISDVAWADSKVHTIRPIAGTSNTELGTLSADSFLLQRKRTIEGIPVRLFGYGAKSLVVVTKRLGRLQFTVLNAASLGDYPGGFDAEAYLARNPDVAAAIGDVPDKYEKAWQHYITYGLAEGRLFSDDFQVDDYLAINPDLQQVFGTDRLGALNHWLAYGKLEGRMGCVPPQFEEDTYFALNPDVEVVFGHNRRLAWFHYATYGILEGRSLDGWFSPAAYLAMYPDLVPALGGKPLAALGHWFRYGRAEGRGIPDWFDLVGYLARYPDVEAAYGNDLYGAWRHFVRWGAAAGRSPDPTCDPVAYLAAYPDLRANLNNDPVKALQHWVAWGKSEGRLASMPAGWDPAYYLGHNSDLMEFGDDEAILWQHCIAYGVLEGREVDVEMKPAVYLSLNPELNAAFGGNLQKAMLHWYLYGKAEGRQGR